MVDKVVLVQRFGQRRVVCFWINVQKNIARQKHNSARKGAKIKQQLYDQIQNHGSCERAVINGRMQDEEKKTNNNVSYIFADIYWCGRNRMMVYNEKYIHQQQKIKNNK